MYIYASDLIRIFSVSRIADVVLDDNEMDDISFPIDLMKSTEHI